MHTVGGTVNMSYGATSSGANAGNVESALEGSFGYSSTTDRSSCDYQLVMNELDQSRPVILDGGTHMWVTSGYYKWMSANCQYGGLQLWMNWGWNGLNNGFYNFDNWTTTAYGVTYDFNSGKHMTVVRKP